MYFYCSYLLSPIPYIRVLLFLLQWSFSDDLALSKSFFIFFVERTIFLILKGELSSALFNFPLYIRCSFYSFRKTLCHRESLSNNCCFQMLSRRIRGQLIRFSERKTSYSLGPLIVAILQL